MLSLENLEKISNICTTIKENIDHFIDHTIFNENNILNDETISIVMTTHKRIKQTLFTLDTISASSYNNIQVILVDDSINEFINHDLLSNYKFRIDYIKIRSENRNWSNPCVNYNIGFNYIKGQFIIIQNAEVCHVNDVIDYVHKNCKEGNYLSFNVINTGSFVSNEKIYEIYKDNKFDETELQKIMKMPGFAWYQHSIKRPRNFHFLTAIHINDFQILGGFDYDFSVGRWCDDDEIYFRIRNVLKLKTVNVEDKYFGIHQHHDTVMLNDSTDVYKKSIKLNKSLFEEKVIFFRKNGYWPIYHK